MQQHQYVSIERYIELHFEAGSAPDPRTVRAWIEAGELEYEVIRRGSERPRYYIDLAQPKAKRSTNPLVNRILDA